MKALALTATGLGALALTVMTGCALVVAAVVPEIVAASGATGPGDPGGAGAAGQVLAGAPGQVLAGAPLPPGMAVIYQTAAGACPGMPWTLLAAIGTVESDNGRSQLPGVRSGSNGAGAEGPMQMEPATFAAYDEPVPPGGAIPPSPYDPLDAAFAAARYLCASGASSPATVPAAVYAYNHDPAYVSRVLSLAATYAGSAGAGPTAGAGSAAGGAGQLAVTYALDQLGVPYEWGGETPGVGFDCSGLTQAAYGAAGVALPRTAQDQFDAGPLVPAGAPLMLGDLVFFGSGLLGVSHVGIYMGTSDGVDYMIDAPHTGAEVRVEPFPAQTGAPWGSDVYVGATRPAYE